MRLTFTDANYAAIAKAEFISGLCDELRAERNPWPEFFEALDLSGSDRSEVALLEKVYCTLERSNNSWNEPRDNLPEMPPRQIPTEVDLFRQVDQNHRNLELADLN